MPDPPRHLRLLWEIDSTPRPGRRPSSSIRDIGLAGVAIADRDGLPAVTMRSVAAELGLSPMGLYRYMDTRDALLEVMLDSMAVAPPADLSEPGLHWREATRRWVAHFAEGLRLHPWAVDLPAGVDLSPTPRVLDWVDAGLRALSGAGLGPADTFAALLALDGVVRGALRQARSAVAGGAGVAVAAGALSEKRFPHLVAHVDVLVAASAENVATTVLDTAVELVLDGIVSRSRTRNPSH